MGMIQLQHTAQKTCRKWIFKHKPIVQWAVKYSRPNAKVWNLFHQGGPVFGLHEHAPCVRDDLHHPHTVLGVLYFLVEMITAGEVGRWHTGRPWSQGDCNDFTFADFPCGSRIRWDKINISARLKCQTFRNLPVNGLRKSRNKKQLAILYQFKLKINKFAEYKLII